MDRMQLTQHFYVDEFTKVKNPSYTSIQWFMLQRLCLNILEPLRNFAGQITRVKNSFTITSGIRSPSDVQRLIRQGYHPSETSDHAFGYVSEVTKEKNVTKYGKYYYYSVGAADIVPSCGAQLLFEKCIPYFNRGEHSIDLPNGRIFVSQFILEKGKRSYWIHVSNPTSLIYQSPVVNFINKDCFLQSKDNGYSYIRV